MLFEIINPSDKVTIEADSATVAGVAGIYLGQGQIGLENEQGETTLPIMAFSGEEALNGWLKQVGIEDLKSWVIEHKDEVAVCLESVVYGSFAERREFLATVEGKDEVEYMKALYDWNDKQRSSLNDYHKACFSLAKAVRELESE